MCTSRNNDHLVPDEDILPLEPMMHIISIDDLSVDFIDDISETADAMFRCGYTMFQPKKRKPILMLFYEPSTRTRFSFEVAAQNLGYYVVGTESAGQFSSAIKGETLEDTIKVLCQYDPAAIVL